MANSPTRGFVFSRVTGKSRGTLVFDHSGMRASLSVAPARVGSLGRAPSRRAAARGLGGRRSAACVTVGARSVPVAEPPVGSCSDRNDDLSRVGSSDVARRAASVAASTLAVCAMAFATAFLTTSAARAFVPVVGCGDPGSPYDTGVERVEPSRDTGFPQKTANCVRLYQPALLAERRAAERASLRAGEKSAADGAYDGTERE